MEKFEVSIKELDMITWDNKTNMWIMDEAFDNAVNSMVERKDACRMLSHLEAVGADMDFLDEPYETENEKARAILAAYLDVVAEVQKFKGEYANEYKTRYDYICVYCAFEKDYFASWMHGCSDYPLLSEIKSFCEYADMLIAMWIEVVEDGYIDPEAGWAE